MIETAGRDEIAPEDLTDAGGIDLLGSWGFIGMHLAAAASLFTGVSWAAVAVCAVTFWIRMFGITACYHRYFSHRSWGRRGSRSWGGASSSARSCAGT